MLRALSTIISLLILLCSTATIAQDEVTFEAKLSKERLGVNERLRVEFSMNKDGDNFDPPSFEGFDVIMGPSQQISSSWINGKRSFSKSYSYILKPLAIGSYQIGQASIQIDGKTYKSVPLDVTVTEAVDNPNAPKTANDIADESLHLVAEVSKNNPYLNEAVTVVYKLYVSPNIRVNNFRPLDNPKYNNFWSQDIPVQRYDATDATYQGKAYRSVILKRVVLYPQKSGQLDIEPLALEIYADVPTDRRDFFGGRIYKSATKSVSAGKRTLQVRPLPEAGKPNDFNGAVGDFEFEVSTSKTTLNASESLQATVQVKGKGNLKLFQLPELVLPSALEVYEPEYDEQVRTNSTGMQGSVANHYTVVPSFRGKYPIPTVSFSYFDPNVGQYKSLKSDEITIDVLEGPEDQNTTSNASPSVIRQPVANGQQFQFIKTETQFSSIHSSNFFKTNRFYGWFFGPLFCIPLVILWRKRRERNNQNVEELYLRKTNRLAKKYLSEARKALGDKADFYIALERALHNYLKAKLKIETSEFSKDRIQQMLFEKTVGEHNIKAFVELLQNCEMARYSPFSQVQMNADYDKAKEVISKIDKQL